MGEVVEFCRREDEVQHWRGEAFCQQCRHTWEASVPAGTVRLECPACGTMKGLLKYEHNLPEGSLVRECRCGNQLFYITPEGHLCPNCGIYQQY